MSHFAKINENNIVTQVIVAEQDFIDMIPGHWEQTSYNTRANTHLTGGEPFRKNYAGIGYIFDGIGFYAPQPFPSWIFNSDTYQWESPVPYPDSDKFYVWDEETISWELLSSDEDNI